MNGAGSSYREDSLHSTATQKHSVDSMIVTRDAQSHYVTAKIATPKIPHTKRKFKRMDDNLMNDSNNCSSNKLNKDTAAAAAVALNRKIVFEIYTQSQEGALRSTTDNSNHHHMPSVVMEILPNQRQNEYHVTNNSHDAPTPVLLRHSSAPNRKELKLTIIPIPSIVTATAAAPTSATISAITPPSSSNIAMKPIAFVRNLFVSLRQSKSRPGFYSPTRDLPPIGKIALHLSANVAIADDADEPNVTNVKRNEQLYSDESDGSISNSSMKHVGQNALEDELSAYMQELREREKR